MFWFTLTVVFSFVAPPPPTEGSWKIGFVLHLGQSFQLQMLFKVGELVLQGSNQELILDWVCLRWRSHAAV